MEIINHECYVSLEVAKLLKEAGFDWNTFYCYRNNIENIEMCHVAFNWNMNKKDYEKEGSDNIFHGFITSDAKALVVDDFISAPTLDVAQQWLREVKNCYAGVEVFVHNLDVDNIYYTYNWVVYFNGDRYSGSDFNTSRYYEVAQEAGIKKAIEIILEKGE